MNREAHVRRALPHWLTLPIDEIVIVDWSSQLPLGDLETCDKRISVVRVEGEPRWILSYAFNLGIERAAGDMILKCDADCLPHADLLSVRPGSGTFFAGDWKTGQQVGKRSVNGQCYFTKSQWLDVNGYSEVLRRYGHDDSDFYSRLVTAGQARKEIEPSLLEFLPHSDADRIVNCRTGDSSNPAQALLESTTGYHETFNIIISALMPWGSWFIRAAYEVLASGPQRTLLQRVRSQEVPLSPAMHALAHRQAMRSMAARLCNVPAVTLNGMSDAACEAALVRHASTTQPRQGMSRAAVQPIAKRT